MRISLSMLLRAGLGASLALNLVLAGLLLTRPERPVRPDISRWQAHLESVLPEADKPAFHRAMEAGRARYDPALEAHRAARDASDAAIRQEPFDPAALRAAMATGRQRWQEFSTAFEDSIVAGMAMISPEGRQKLADEIRGRNRRPRAEGERGGPRGRQD